MDVWLYGCMDEWMGVIVYQVSYYREEAEDQPLSYMQ